MPTRDFTLELSRGVVNPVYWKLFDGDREVNSGTAQSMLEARAAAREKAQQWVSELKDAPPAPTVETISVAA